MAYFEIRLITRYMQKVKEKGTTVVKYNNLIKTFKNTICDKN